MSIERPEAQGPSTHQYSAPAQQPAPSNPYSPNESQYVAPLQAWPPQELLTPMQDERKPVILPWLFVALGIIMPLSAIITAIYAGSKTRDGDSRYFYIAVAGVIVFVVMMWIGIEAAKEEHDKMFPDRSAPKPRPTTP